jgi:mannose-6-phosphate isomerase
MSDYLGLTESGGPMAEVWFGTHPGSMTKTADGSHTVLELRHGRPLSFLMKFLAADQSLSIQAHPTRAQAQSGFERENEAGIPQTSPIRNYKDDQHKPEAIVALSDFEALCGFKTDTQIRELIEDILSYPITEVLREIATDWLVKLESGLQTLFSHILHTKKDLVELGLSLAALADFDGRFELMARLNQQHPGDPGIAIALLMNQVRLAPGQGLALPAGNIHAYLSGIGVEVMAASDNVLRGGLTTKHIDIDELERVVDFETRGAKPVEHKTLATGFEQLLTPFDEDFLLYRIEPSSQAVHADIQIPTDAIAVCTSGEVAISDSQGAREVLTRGEAAFVAAEARAVSFAGTGTVYLAIGRD